MTLETTSSYKLFKKSITNSDDFVRKINEMMFKLHHITCLTRRLSLVSNQKIRKDSIEILNSLQRSLDDLKDNLQSYMKKNKEFINFKKKASKPTRELFDARLFKELREENYSDFNKFMKKNRFIKSLTKCDINNENKFVTENKIGLSNS